MTKNNGLTLLELVVAMSILSILAGLAGFATIRGLVANGILSAAESIYADVRAARSEAVREIGDVFIIFDETSDSYEIVSTKGNQQCVKQLPDGIDLYKVSGASAGKNGKKVYIFNSRGTKEGVSGAVYLRHHNAEQEKVRVRVTSAGRVAIETGREGDWS